MIIGYLGNIGSGKTCSLVRLAFRYYLQGYTVYSNISLQFPHETIRFKDLEAYAKSGTQFQKSFFLIDEIHMALESRRSGSKRNIVLSHLILQSRKRDIQVGFTTQSLHQVDVRLRNQTDVLGVCSKRQDGMGVIIKVQYIIFRAEGTRIRKSRYVANNWFRLYDTYEIVGMT